METALIIVTVILGFLYILGMYYLIRLALFSKKEYINKEISLIQKVNNPTLYTTFSYLWLAGEIEPIHSHYPLFSNILPPHPMEHMPHAIKGSGYRLWCMIKLNDLEVVSIDEIEISEDQVYEAAIAKYFHF